MKIIRPPHDVFGTMKGHDQLIFQEWLDELETKGAANDVLIVAWLPGFVSAGYGHPWPVFPEEGNVPRTAPVAGPKSLRSRCRMCGKTRVVSVLKHWGKHPKKIQEGEFGAENEHQTMQVQNPFCHILSLSGLFGMGWPCRFCGLRDS